MNIPYGRQNIEQFEIDEVIKTLKSDFLTQGPKVHEFEKCFANYVGSKYAVAVSNATAGLHISVKSLGLKAGDRIITSPITFASSANCARFVGAEVWFADIDPNTYLISLEKTKDLLESKPKGFFKGILPVDFGGLPVNMEAFRKLANEYDLWIVEDACHAPGGYFIDSTGNNIMCGQGVYSDCSVFSFHPVKHIACGEGGMVTTNSKKIYEKLMLLRAHGISKENMEDNHGGWYYEMQELGYNYRLTDIQATLGITQLAKNSSGVEKRNEIAENYKKAFKGLIKHQSLPKGMLNAHHLFVVEVENRLNVYNQLRERGIYGQIHYIPVHKLPYYSQIGYNSADLTNAENYYSRCISLPMFPSLKGEEQDFVINTILELINE